MNVFADDHLTIIPTGSFKHENPKKCLDDHQQTNPYMQNIMPPVKKRVWAKKPSEA